MFMVSIQEWFVGYYGAGTIFGMKIILTFNNMLNFGS